MARLLVCGACARHVHETEEQCPFCDAPLARRTCEAATPGLSRAAQYALQAALITSAAVSASCKDDAQGTKSPADLHGADTTGATSTAVTTATTNEPSTTGSGLTTATSTGTVIPPGAFACGAGTCGPGQVCLHPCTPCGGRAAQMGNCPPQAPPRCVSSVATEGAQIQGNDAYQHCPAMPYGCVFPNDCGRVSV